MNQFWHFASQHIGAFTEGSFASLLMNAVIREWPEKFPGINLQEWWTWGRNTGQQILSMKGIPTQPVGPAKTGVI